MTEVSMDDYNPCAECGVPDYNGEHLERCSLEDDLETCGVCNSFYNGNTDSKFPMECECNEESTACVATFIKALMVETGVVDLGLKMGTE